MATNETSSPQITDGTQRKKDEIIYVNFNQDQGCFSAGTQTGFRIFNTKPFKDQFRRDLQGGIGIVEMLFRCNILALVGGGNNPKFPPNKVMLWDDHQQKVIGELAFKTKVQAVRLRKDKVVVVLESRVYVYNFADLRLIDAIDTINNPKGLCALNPEGKSSVLVTPAAQKGFVRVALYAETNTNMSFKAHDNCIDNVALTNDGSILVTASEIGTIFRLFFTNQNQSGGSLQPFQEVRRGIKNAVICSLAFDKLGGLLAASSDHGTIHIFAVENPQGESNKKNKQSALAGMFGNKEKSSFAQLRVGDERTKVGFSDDSKSLFVISQTGKFYEASIPEESGDCKIQGNYDYLGPMNQKQGQGGPM